MKVTVFNICMFFLAFQFSYSILLPTAVLYDFIPMWAAILLLSYGLMRWLTFTNRFAKKIFITNKIKNDDY